MDILVLGGTRFFGKVLISQLLDKGHTVTIATRGKTSDPFGERVNRIVVDRFSETSLREAFSGTQWDVIYDQICYTPDEAKLACDVFAGKVGRYIFTSSMAVYDEFKEEPFTESDFDPYTYSLKAGGQADFSYGEGKRLAEAYFYQKATFPVVAVRFPIVMGEGDYTERLTFHIEHIKEKKPFYVPNEKSKMCYISSEEAGAYLAWLADSELTGPVNACSDGIISIKDLIALIEKIVGEQAVLSSDNQDAERSPYGAAGTKTMSTKKAQEAGYSFTNLHDWLPKLIKVQK